MDTLLTLVIAVGGIATGIGVIWTSLATRRQAQLTERSLAEHNERLSLNLEVDLLHRMQDRYDSQLFMGRGRAVARYFLDNAFVDDTVEVERLNEAAIDVCDFFEYLAYLQWIDALSTKSVWNVFGADIRVHWDLCKPGIEKQREKWQDTAIYEEFEQLSRLMADMDASEASQTPRQKCCIESWKTKPSEAKSHPPPRSEGICRRAASLPNFRER
jgi:hypothetical protein